MILGIDTSLTTTVALIDDDGVILAHRDSADTRGHAEVIGTLIQEALAEAPGGHEISAVAAGMGPGPFTGLRIGIAAARAFALGRGVPVIPVVSHDAIALGRALADPFAEPGRFAVVTDARRREVAWSVYDGVDDDGLPVRVTGPALVARTGLETALGDVPAVEATAVSGAMIATLAVRARAAGRTIGPRDALYLRSPDVTPPARPKKVGV